MFLHAFQNRTGLTSGFTAQHQRLPRTPQHHCKTRRFRKSRHQQTYGFRTHMAHHITLTKPLPRSDVGHPIMRKIRTNQRNLPGLIRNNGIARHHQSGTFPNQMNFNMRMMMPFRQRAWVAMLHPTHRSLRVRHNDLQYAGIVRTSTFRHESTKRGLSIIFALLAVAARVIAFSSRF